MTSEIRGSYPLLYGIITPIITPLLECEKLDLDALSLLIDRLVHGDVSGLFLLGTTGEFAGMSHTLRHEFVRESMKRVNDRMPVYVGISDTSFTESVDLANTAADCGAAAVVLTAPYYYRFSGRVMRDYLTKMAQTIPLPIVLYNMPGNTKVMLEPDTIRFVMDMPEFIGVKDSSGDLDYFENLCRMATVRSDFAVMMGPDRLLRSALLMGAHGGVSAGSNLVPDVYTGMYRAGREGDQALMDSYQKRIELVQRIYHVSQNGLGVATGLKTALSFIGIGTPCLTLPFPPPTNEEREAIRDAVEQLGLIGTRT